MAEIKGGGPHDGAHVQLPADCIAVVIVSENPDGEYLSTLAIRDGKHVVNERLAECLVGLATGRLIEE